MEILHGWKMAFFGPFIKYKCVRKFIKGRFVQTRCRLLFYEHWTFWSKTDLPINKIEAQCPEIVEKIEIWN